MNALRSLVILSATFLSITFSALPRADVVTDWNEKACNIVARAGAGATGPRIMAVVQVAVFDAVSSIDGGHRPFIARVDAPAGASIDAAVASANRKVLLGLLAAEKTEIEKAYDAAIAAIPAGKSKDDGIAVGERAAANLLARAAKDPIDARDTYQPHTSPGMYVPTMIPVFQHWAKRTPWTLARADELRPGPPPKLDSETWARDYNQVRLLGGKHSTARTKEQTDIALFWEETRPPLYHGLVRSAANTSGRTPAQNARLMAAAAVALDDALIAVFDAKYAYNFWRPMTAIRNGHMSANPAVEAEAGWMPLINTPMHPEYPCAHCVSSGAVGTVIEREFAGATLPRLSTTSALAGNKVREWTSVAELMEEVMMARIYDGVHYRNSAEVGNELGRKVAMRVLEAFGR